MNSNRLSNDDKVFGGTVMNSTGLSGVSSWRLKIPARSDVIGKLVLHNRTFMISIRYIESEDQAVHLRD